jgi:flavin reductase (DIM6/NTAB) family NADH-FMN oxidoreductase RutF
MPKDSLIKATMQLPCSAVIISASSGLKRAAMTAAAMFISQSPPLIAVSVSKTFATYHVIEESGEFVVNAITDRQLEFARKVGSVHGYDMDKFAEFKIAIEPASKIKSPVISGSFASFECQVRSRVEETQGGHIIYIAEVVAFNMNDQSKPLVWLNNRYFNVGSECQI